jgi:hypothetical protein
LSRPRNPSSASRPTGRAAPRFRAANRPVKPSRPMPSVQRRGRANEMGETRDETIAVLRKKLGRKPTKEEVDAARKTVIRRAYADMALTAIMFLDEKLD